MNEKLECYFEKKYSLSLMYGKHYFSKAIIHLRQIYSTMHIAIILDTSGEYC